MLEGWLMQGLKLATKERLFTRHLIRRGSNGPNSSEEGERKKDWFMINHFDREILLIKKYSFLFCHQKWIFIFFIACLCLACVVDSGRNIYRAKKIVSTYVLQPIIFKRNNAPNSGAESGSAFPLHQIPPAWQWNGDDQHLRRHLGCHRHFIGPRHLHQRVGLRLQYEQDHLQFGIIY